MSTETSVRPRAPTGVRRSGFARVLRAGGWTLITAGILVLLFVVYELFVTNLITDRHQTELRQDLTQQFRRGGTHSVDPPEPIPGGALGILRIPRIDLDVAVVEGVGVTELKKGPGHYPKTPLPGRGGNVGIAGHRTTYGRPFWGLDRLRTGDEISLRTARGTFVYEVRWKRVVDPNFDQVLDHTRRPVLSRTTCNPRFSAAERLVVRARLVRAPPGVEVG